MSDLTTWLNDTATFLIAELPLQSRDDALVLAEAYLSDVGGWVPIDPLQPNGEGAPANSDTAQLAADQITKNEFNGVYDLNFSVNVVLSLQVPAKLSTGLTLNDAATSMVNQVIDFINNRIDESPIPLRVESIGAQVANNSGSNFGNFVDLTKESTTQAIRQLIDDEITSSDKLIDFKASTLKYTRETYGLNNTWNVSSVFTMPSEPITIQVQKYIDDTYATLDSGSHLIYVLTISPDTYAIVSGVILTT